MVSIYEAQNRSRQTPLVSILGVREEKVIRSFALQGLCVLLQVPHSVNQSVFVWNGGFKIEVQRI
jgi:hypothetical protein